eukprot:6196799-Pleurochrysis_carterae.AAC.1
MCADVHLVASGAVVWVDPTLNPLRLRRGAHAPRCPSTLPSALACQGNVATGDDGRGEHPGRVRARWRRQRAATCAIQVRSCVPSTSAGGSSPCLNLTRGRDRLPLAYCSVRRITPASELATLCACAAL